MYGVVILKVKEINTIDFILIMDRFKNDSRFEKSDLTQIMESIWNSNDIQQSLKDYINDNADKIEFQDLIEDLN